MTQFHNLYRHVVLTASATSIATVSSAQARDTCAKWERPDREIRVSAGDTALNPVITGRWKQLVEIRRGFFTMMVPASARISGGESATRIDQLPDCRLCIMEISWFVPETPLSVMVTKMVADAKAAVQSREFSDIDERFPPRRVSVGRSTGYWLVGDCGDCGQRHLYVQGKDRVAHIQLTVDGNQWIPGPMCHMEHAAESFRWLRH